MDGYAQSNLGVLLNRADNPEEILCVRVSLRGEHAVQALVRLPDFSRKLFETDRRVDEVAKHRLAGCRIAGKTGIDGLAEQGFAKLRIALYPCNKVTIIANRHSGKLLAGIQKETLDVDFRRYDKRNMGIYFCGAVVRT